MIGIRGSAWTSIALVLALLAVSCARESGSPPDDLTTASTLPPAGAVGDQLPAGELSPDLLPAIVATDDIRAGTTAAAALADGRLETQVIARELFPEDAIVTPELIETTMINQFVTGGTIMRITMFDAIPPTLHGE